jgi:hypothetical protein
MRTRPGVLVCASMTLPADSLERRQITRPVEYRQPGFDDEFDATTVFYDVIALGPWPLGRLVLIAPPLRNFTEAIMAGRINGRPVRTLLSRYFERDRCCDIWLSTTLNQPVHLKCELGSALLFPSRAEPRRYAGRRVLYTLSKENNPLWVIDWARFHVANHGADAVLIYDNGSVRYTASGLLAMLRAALPGLTVDVVSWPFPYGPGGFSSASGWDSDFCQAAAFQNARFRFLERAAGVLNCDVDELVVPVGGRSVFEAAATSTAGCVAFAGDWIASTCQPSDPKSAPRHGDFVHRETESPRCPIKWCVVPARIADDYDWSTHRVRMPGFAEAITDEFSYAHLRAISNDWKYRRSPPVALDPALHSVHGPLQAALERAGLRRRVYALEDES